MNETRLSILVVALLIGGAITVIFGGILKDYALAAGVGAVAAAIFAAVAFFMAGSERPPSAKSGPDAGSDKGH